jgi:hypothetical protein
MLPLLMPRLCAAAADDSAANRPLLPLPSLPSPRPTVCHQHALRRHRHRHRLLAVSIAHSRLPKRSSFAIT